MQQFEWRIRRSEKRYWPFFCVFFSSFFGSAPEALNFWMGENRSVSSLHKDPYDNLYAVIEGEKHFTLIPELYYPYL